MHLKNYIEKQERTLEDKITLLGTSMTGDTGVQPQVLD